MAESPLRIFDTWSPFLDALRDTAPEGTHETVFEGTVFPMSWGGATFDDGDTNRRSDAGWESRDRLSAAVEPVQGLVGGRGCAVRARVTRSGDREVRLVEIPDGVTFGMGNELIEAVVLVPGAHPEPYRRVPVRYDGVVTSPGADADAVTSVLRAALPEAVPASHAELDAAEAALGLPLPADVRALYLAAGSGVLVLAPEDEDDGLWYGMRIVALDDQDARAYLRPEARYLSWRYGATEVVAPDPQDRVQPLAVSPAWFVIGDDWGGNLFVVDLAPGPRGHVGQVLYVDHETNSGARWVAPSLTELLVGRSQVLAPFGPRDELLVRIAAHTGRTLAEVSENTEVVIVNRVPVPVDLSPLAGHRRLRTLVVEPGPVTGLDVVTALPSLEYLQLDLAGWQSLLEADRLPPTLLAAGFSGRADWTATLEVLNALLARWEQPPVEVTELRSKVPATAQPVQERSAMEQPGPEQAALEQPSAPRPWWRRLFGPRS